MAAEGPGFAGLNVFATNPSDVADLLSDALGLELRQRTEPDGHHYSGRAAGLVISVHPSERAALELAFLTPDLEDSVGRCEAEGATVSEAPHEVPYGTSARLTGPDPIRLELVQPGE